MRILLFCHSIASCWNHGNAHFLRGLVRALMQQGHDVRTYEPADGWSRQNLAFYHGSAALTTFLRVYPELCCHTYHADHFDYDQALDGADLVLVHGWTDPRVVARLGEYRRRNRSLRLLFHETHHRVVSAPGEMARYDLKHYDGVLAFGEVLTQHYLSRGLCERAWTFHEAADTTVFSPPLRSVPKVGDLVWIGNWGDDERSDELEEFLLRPVERLRIDAQVYGVRYPEHASIRLRAAGIRYGGWLPNHQVADAFHRFRMTVHVPRRYYRSSLPGIPTIRVFEALAAGIPLVCSPWSDTEGLFRGGRDYWTAENGAEMERCISQLMQDDAACKALSEAGRQSIVERHTCAHRARELMAIYDEIAPSRAEETWQPASTVVASGV
ncbi:MAG TPA: glycosyltransferase [Polyangiaceae bacterium]|nr:glycosyltransferase [Polyangiaceae bacterium]